MGELNFHVFSPKTSHKCPCIHRLHVRDSNCTYPLVSLW